MQPIENSHYLKGIFLSYLENLEEIRTPQFQKEVLHYYNLSHNQFIVSIYTLKMDYLKKHFLCLLQEIYNIINSNPLSDSDFIVLFPQLFNTAIPSIVEYDVILQRE